MFIDPQCGVMQYHAALSHNTNQERSVIEELRKRITLFARNRLFLFGYDSFPKIMNVNYKYKKVSVLLNTKTIPSKYYGTYVIKSRGL